MRGPDHLEDNSLTWPYSTLEHYLFIPGLGYTTAMLYCVLAGPESGGSLLLMICWFYHYVRQSMLLRRSSPTQLATQSLDNQHVSSVQISPVSPLPVVGIANDVAQGIVYFA